MFLLVAASFSLLFHQGERNKPFQCICSVVSRAVNMVRKSDARNPPAPHTHSLWVHTQTIATPKKTTNGENAKPHSRLCPKNKWYFPPFNFSKLLIVYAVFHHYRFILIDFLIQSWWMPKAFLITFTHIIEIVKGFSFGDWFLYMFMCIYCFVLFNTFFIYWFLILCCFNYIWRVVNVIILSFYSGQKICINKI